MHSLTNDLCIQELAATTNDDESRSRLPGTWVETWVRDEANITLLLHAYHMRQKVYNNAL